MEDVMDCVVQVDRSRTDGRTASDENFKLFSTNSRFVVFGRLRAKKVLFWAKYTQKQCFMVKKSTITRYIYIAYYSHT